MKATIKSRILIACLLAGVACSQESEHNTGVFGLALAALSASSAVTLSKTSVSIGESGTTDTYTIVLGKQPSSDVVITVSADAQTLVGGTSTATVTFTSSNWNIAQTITVSAVDDTTYESAHTGSLTHGISSTDTNFSTLSLAAVSASITDNEKRIFVTASTTTGDIDTNNNGNPVVEADALCAADANKPSGSAVWKAMIVDGTNRRACTGANCTSSSENIDWALAANSTYVRAASTTTILFTTNSAGIFVFGTLTNSITGAADNYWTGLATTWIVDAGDDCTNFNNGTAGGNAGAGIGNATGNTAIRATFQTCDFTYKLLCVEQ